MFDYLKINLFLDNLKTWKFLRNENIENCSKKCGFYIKCKMRLESIILKGIQGPKGDTGPQGPSGATASVATQTSNGLMSAADKKKLDGISSGGVKVIKHPIEASFYNPEFTIPDWATFYIVSFDVCPPGTAGKNGYMYYFAGPFQTTTTYTDINIGNCPINYQFITTDDDKNSSSTQSIRICYESGKLKVYSNSMTGIKAGLASCIMSIIFI